MASGRVLAWLVTFAVATGLLGRLDHVRAQDSCIEALTDRQVTALADEIDSRLPNLQRRTRIYFWGFLSFQGLGVIGASVLAVMEHRPSLHANYVWGAAGSSLGTTMMLAPPLPGIALRRRIGRRPSDDPDALRVYVARAYRALEHAAQVERTVRSPWMHAGTGAFALAEGLQLGLSYRNSTSLALSNAIGTAVFGELQIWTSPRIAERTRDAIRRQACGPPPPPAPTQLEIHIQPGIGSLTTTVRW